jgi:hypothetical protein
MPLLSLATLGEATQREPMQGTLTEGEDTVQSTSSFWVVCFVTNKNNIFKEQI